MSDQPHFHTAMTITCDSLQCCRVQSTSGSVTYLLSTDGCGGVELAGSEVAPSAASSALSPSDDKPLELLLLLSPSAVGEK